mmetsp:Transcript_34333/g.75671  ORF Transcript_34333/g.75671 Transcript_34333/m.75671 type:complete len:239 (-) Transcript_34333:534-1250(-)
MAQTLLPATSIIHSAVLTKSCTEGLPRYVTCMRDIFEPSSCQLEIPIIGSLTKLPSSIATPLSMRLCRTIRGLCLEPKVTPTSSSTMMHLHLSFNLWAVAAVCASFRMSCAVVSGVHCSRNLEMENQPPRPRKKSVRGSWLEGSVEAQRMSSEELFVLPGLPTINWNIVPSSPITAQNRLRTFSFRAWLIAIPLGRIREEHSLEARPSKAEYILPALEGTGRKAGLSTWPARTCTQTA